MLKPGDEVDGRYRVDEVLGVGGMGIVYKAQEIALNRTVALKTLRGSTVDTDWIERLRREAITLAKIKHRNIIHVYKTGVDSDNTLYISMEYVDSLPLNDVLNREHVFPWQRTLAIARQICDALACAHRLGIVHRDIKPNNILLVTQGSEDLVKIIDFGLCILPIHDMDRLTQPGMALGTASYMSPEQCAGQPADARSDIYSVGCVLYELLSGTPVFTGDSVIAILFQHIHVQPVPMRIVNPTIVLPHALDAIIMKMLEKSPSDRYQAMQEVLDDIEDIAKQKFLPQTSAEAGQMQDRSLRLRGRTVKLCAASLGLITIVVISLGNPHVVGMLAGVAANDVDYRRYMALASWAQKCGNRSTAIILLEKVIRSTTISQLPRLTASTKLAELYAANNRSKDAQELACHVISEIAHTGSIDQNNEQIHSRSCSLFPLALKSMNILSGLNIPYAHLSWNQDCGTIARIAATSGCGDLALAITQQQLVTELSPKNLLSCYWATTDLLSKKARNVPDAETRSLLEIALLIRQRLSFLSGKPYPPQAPEIGTFIKWKDIDLINKAEVEVQKAVPPTQAADLFELRRAQMMWCLYHQQPLKAKNIALRILNTRDLPEAKERRALRSCFLCANQLKDPQLFSLIESRRSALRSSRPKME